MPKIKEEKDPNTCPTVRIVSPQAPGGYVVINEEDFDPDTDKLWSPQPRETLGLPRQPRDK